jgi:hypothetical protein
VFEKFPKCHMEILLGDSMPKQVEKTLLSLQLGMKVYKNDTGVRVVNFATS